MIIISTKNIKYLLHIFLWLTLVLSDRAVGQVQTKSSDTIINCLNFPDSLQGQKIFNINNCDTQPQFIGGDVARIKYLTENLKFPISTVPDTITFIQFFLSFIIDTNGKVNNVCVFYRANHEQFIDIEKEGIRVFENMPNWIPGIKNGIKVPVILIMPLQLNLN